MSRALWKGAISFGLVHVPVELHSAEKRNTLDFDMLDRRDMNPVGSQRINKETGKVVPWNEIVKGYEHKKGEYVVVTDEDFRRANVEATQTIDIINFVNLTEIPLIYFDTPYYLAAGRGGDKGYALMRQTLKRADKAGIAQVVIRSRQRLAALVPQGEMLILNTLRYQYEIRPNDEIEVPAGKKAAANAREVAMALKLVEEMTDEWRPEKYHDTYREDLLKHIKKKIRSGDTETVAESEEPAKERKSAEIIDLVSLLKRSIDRNKQEDEAAEKPRRRKRA